MHFSTAGNFAILTLALLLLPSFPAFAQPNPAANHQPNYHHHHIRRGYQDLSTTPAKTAHLLHCLGKGPRVRADHAKVQALIEANPGIPADDEKVWSTLGPKEWGFKGHDAGNADTWEPVQGAAQTGKDRVQRQKEKLMKCVTKLRDDFQKQQGGSVGKPRDEQNNNDDPTRRMMPNMWGGQGFKQVKQGSDVFFLRHHPTAQKNDLQAMAPGPSPGGGPDPGAGAPDPQKGGAGEQPADGNKGAPGIPPPAAGGAGITPPGQDQKPTSNDTNSPPDAQKNAAPGTALSTAGGQKPSSDGTTATPGTAPGAAPGAPPTTGDLKPNPDGTTNPTSPDGQKLPPGIGSDQSSVAPALENDPQQKNLPKPSTAAGAAAGGAAAGASGAALTTDPSNPGTTPPTTDGTQSTLPAPISIGTVPQISNFSQSTTKDAVAVAADPSNPAPGTLTPPGQLTSSNQLSGTTPPPGSTCKQILIRKEYSTLTREEKKQFVEAIKCVRAKPSRFRSDPGWNAADDWTLLHIRMVKYVHFTAYFTSFHRGFLSVVERDLNLCGFPLGLPWVDWTKTSDDPSTNLLFDSDPEYGLGTNGQGDNKDCPWGTGLAVTDGALSDHFFNAPFRHRLCRQFNNMNVNDPNPHFGSNCTTFIDANFIKGLGATHDDGKFFDFSSALEISTHLSMHTCIGGNLAWLSSSPNDVAFHVHHGCVDNIYDAWQKKNPKNKVAFHGPKAQQKNGAHPPWTAKREDVINFSPMAENVAVQDLLDHTSGAWGGRMCYEYDRNVDM